MSNAYTQLAIAAAFDRCGGPMTAQDVAKLLPPGAPPPRAQTFNRIAKRLEDLGLVVRAAPQPNPAGGSHPQWQRTRPAARVVATIASQALLRGQAPATLPAIATQAGCTTLQAEHATRMLVQEGLLQRLAYIPEQYVLAAG